MNEKDYNDEPLPKFIAEFNTKSIMVCTRERNGLYKYEVLGNVVPVKPSDNQLDGLNWENATLGDNAHSL